MAKTKTFIVSVDNNERFCGEGAGGAQFAHGKATITNEHLANWFKNHKGYTVTEVKESKESKADEK